jgi:hypothetical protein
MVYSGTEMSLASFKNNKLTLSGKICLLASTELLFLPNNSMELRDKVGTRIINKLMEQNRFSESNIDSVGQKNSYPKANYCIKKNITIEKRRERSNLIKIFQILFF